jgi:guanidinopropionase
MDRSIIPPVDSGRIPRFSEIATFMRAPRIDDLDRVDVALVGVPFDLGVGFRPGTRQGPAAIREASRLIRRVHATTGFDPFAAVQVADLGDVATHPFDLPASFEMIAGFFGGLRDHDVRPVAAGGDHSITLPILRGLRRDEPLGLVQVDSHPDIFDEFLGNRYNHATPIRRAVEEGLLDPRRIVQVGLRGGRASAGDWDWGLEAGIRMISYDEYEELGRAGVIAEIGRVIGDGPAYITFDIDGLDPSHAPGTGVPEPGGISMRDAQVLLRAMHGRAIVGADVVEVAPTLDPTGLTAVSAANVMYELLCLVAAAKAG